MSKRDKKMSAYEWALAIIWALEFEAGLTKAAERELAEACKDSKLQTKIHKILEEAGYMAEFRRILEKVGL